MNIRNIALATALLYAIPLSLWGYHYTVTRLTADEMAQVEQLLLADETILPFEPSCKKSTLHPQIIRCRGFYVHLTWTKIFVIDLDGTVHDPDARQEERRELLEQYSEGIWI